MKSTQRLTVTMALAAMAAIITFGPISSAESAPDVSPFAGSWSGTWSIAERNLSGSFAWTISDSGQLTGTVSGSGRSGAIAGTNGVPFKGTAEWGGDGSLLITLVGADSDRLLLVATLVAN